MNFEPVRKIRRISCKCFKVFFFFLASLMITRHEFHSGCFVSMRSVACKILYDVISNDKVNVVSSIS